MSRWTVSVVVNLHCHFNWIWNRTQSCVCKSVAREGKLRQEALLQVWGHLPTVMVSGRRLSTQESEWSANTPCTLLLRCEEIRVTARATPSPCLSSHEDCAFIARPQISSPSLK